MSTILYPPPLFPRPGTTNKSTNANIRYWNIRVTLDQEELWKQLIAGFVLVVTTIIIYLILDSSKNLLLLFSLFLCDQNYIVYPFRSSFFSSVGHPAIVLLLK